MDRQVTTTCPECTGKVYSVTDEGLNLTLTFPRLLHHGQRS